MLESERANGPARADGFRAARLRFGDDWTAVHRLVDGTKMRLRAYPTRRHTMRVAANCTSAR
jgi:hypothetical protein